MSTAPVEWLENSSTRRDRFQRGCKRVAGPLAHHDSIVTSGSRPTEQRSGHYKPVVTSTTQRGYQSLKVKPLRPITYVTSLVWCMTRPLNWTARAKRALIKGLVTIRYISCVSTTTVIEPIKLRRFINWRYCDVWCTWLIRMTFVWTASFVRSRESCQAFREQSGIAWRNTKDRDNEEGNSYGLVNQTLLLGALID